MTGPAKTIGQLNGWASILFRINLVVVPMLVAWASWATSETFENRAFRNQGNRFTATDAAAMEARILHVISELPPGDWRQRIVEVEGRWFQIDARLDKIERTQERIVTLIEERN